ncbi:MAG: hypothetical protein ACUVQP_08075 [Bacteroidales bacterium]
MKGISFVIGVLLNLTIFILTNCQTKTEVDLNDLQQRVCVRLTMLREYHSQNVHVLKEFKQNNVNFLQVDNGNSVTNIYSYDTNNIIISAGISNDKLSRDEAKRILANYKDYLASHGFTFEYTEDNESFYSNGVKNQTASLAFKKGNHTNCFK